MILVELKSLVVLLFFYELLKNDAEIPLKRVTELKPKLFLLHSLCPPASKGSSRLILAWWLGSSFGSTVQIIFFLCYYFLRSHCQSCLDPRQQSQVSIKPSHGGWEGRQTTLPDGARLCG